MSITRSVAMNAPRSVALPVARFTAYSDVGDVGVVIGKDRSPGPDMCIRSRMRRVGPQHG